MRYYPSEKKDNKLTCKFNKFFCSLQQVESFLNTICKVNRAKKIINLFKK